MPAIREEPVGDMERLDGDADGVSIGVVTTAGKRQNGRFALDCAIVLLRYFNDYFGVGYPLPKLDLIAVPGGFGGAMENWGGITFFESRLLFDPASSSPSSQRGIFGILAHEMAAFSDREHAAQLSAFAPVRETPGGRTIAARAEESILLDADFCAEKLPAIDAWIAQHAPGR